MLGSIKAGGSSSGSLNCLLDVARCPTVLFVGEEKEGAEASGGGVFAYTVRCLGTEASVTVNGNAQGVQNDDDFCI